MYDAIDLIIDSEIGHFITKICPINLDMREAGIASKFFASIVLKDVCIIYQNIDKGMKNS